MVLSCAALCFIILAIARPQWGNKKRKVIQEGVDILFLLDTSKSMLTKDILPNRFEKARMKIKTYVKRLESDRIGLVVFSGSSYLQCPLTMDYSAFMLFLDSVEVGIIPDKGTSLADALMTAIASFQGQERKYDIIILLSDGEDHEGGIGKIAEKITNLGIHTYVIGVGTKDGMPIPTGGSGNVFKKDLSGNVIISKLEENNLRKISQITGGLYCPLTNSDRDIDIVYNHIKLLEKKELSKKMIIQREDHYQIFLLIALLFLVIELVIYKKKA